MFTCTRNELLSPTVNQDRHVSNRLKDLRANRFPEVAFDRYESMSKGSPGG
jgi:hypothetical protein